MSLMEQLYIAHLTRGCKPEVAYHHAKDEADVFQRKENEACGITTAAAVDAEIVVEYAKTKRILDAIRAEVVAYTPQGSKLVGPTLADDIKTLLSWHSGQAAKELDRGHNEGWDQCMAFIQERLGQLKKK